MAMTTKLLCTLVAVLLCSAANAVVIGEWVSFPDAPNPPTALQVRLATEQSIEPKLKTSPTYWGKLYQPEGKGPFPAIVFVETCWGPMRDKGLIYEPWIETLSGWGYVVLRINRCIPDIDAHADRTAYPLRLNQMAFVAYAGLSYLSDLPFVDARRIAALGWSVDGTAVLTALNQAGPQQLFDKKFRLGVAFYPWCGSDTGPFVAPVLVVIGANDDWTLVKRCERMANEKTNTHVSVYPNVIHGFDLAGLGEEYFYKDVFNLEKNPARGVMAGYNEAAHESALREIEAFLEDHLHK